MSTLVARTVRRALVHPAAMAIKQRVRDAIWLVKGRRIVNPPLPTAIGSMLFVCLGNICRSPFAEHVTRRRLAAAGATATRVASAGITARQGNVVPTLGRQAALRTYGLDLRHHAPQRLTRDMVDSHDLIVVMEAGQLAALRALYPHAAARLVLLSLYDPAPVLPHQRFHIDDPFGGSATAFDGAFGRIDRAVAVLLERTGAMSKTA